MPIKKNSRFHDFEWEHDVKDSDQDELSFSLRYHQTNEYGSTVSMLNEDNSIAFSFPVDFFRDVAGEVSRVNRLNDPRSEDPVMIPSTKSSSSPVDLPVINGPGMFKTGSHQTEEPVAVTAVELPDMEEIEQPAEGFVSFSANNTDVKTGATEANTETNELSDNEISSNEDIKEERGTSPEDWMKQRAKRSKKASKKSIKKLKD